MGVRRRRFGPGLPFSYQATYLGSVRLRAGSGRTGAVFLSARQLYARRKLGLTQTIGVAQRLSDRCEENLGDPVQPGALQCTERDRRRKVLQCRSTAAVSWMKFSRPGPF